MNREGGATTFITLFIRRPILAFVVSALLVMTGLAAMTGIEVRELPSVERPIITITTPYSGASPETIDQEVTARVEAAVGRIEGIVSLSSSSSFGRSRVTLEFSDQINIDVAATDTRDALSRIANDLPTDADLPEVVKADADAQPVLRLALTGKGQTPEALTQLVDDLVSDRLLAIPGVADLQIYGDRTPVFRVDIDFRQLASRGIALGAVQTALRNASYDVPTGSLEPEGKSLTVRASASLSDAQVLESLLIQDNVRLGDIASILLGPGEDTTYLRANGQTGIGMGIVRQAGTNTLTISQRVHEEVDAINTQLPEDVSLFVTSDDATFIDSAIEEVIKTLIVAMIIVVGVIYVFLRTVRATLVPAVAMPVALVATLAGLYVAGFSLNILTLLALVLATGMVVDDAIVVLENITRLRLKGMGAKAAAVIGTRQVFFAVITTTATLAAVFIPLSFLPGQAGGLFKEFGFTLAIAVAMSSVVALTLCPVMAGAVLDTEFTLKDTWVTRLGSRLTKAYGWSLRLALRHSLVVLVFVGLVSLTAVAVFETLRQELTPREDRAVALLSLTAPQGVSIDYTERKVGEIETLIQPLVASGEISSVFSIVGIGSGNRAFMVFSLAPWGERNRDQDAIVSDINQSLSSVVGIRAFAIQPNSLGIRGGGRGLSLAVTGDTYPQILEAAERLAEAMRENPAFGEVDVSFDASQPQLSVNIDREKAADQGIDITDLGIALRALLGSQNAGTLFVNDKSYDIQLLSTKTPVNDPTDLENIYIRNTQGTLLPLSSIVDLETTAVAGQLTRENKRRAIEVTASLSPQLPLGEALAQARVLAQETLDPVNQVQATGEAAELDKTNANLLTIFGFTLLVIFLVLAAQFESITSALVVMITVPMGVACAIFALALTGTSLNIYSQIGLILLIGIMAKNGILIVEFANQLRDEGQSVASAVLDSAQLRLRPVMMTMVSTVMGGIPLILSAGAGAEARTALGWVIVGGLGMATLSTLYVTPVAYNLLARFSKPRIEGQKRLEAELSDVEATLDR